MSDQLSEIQSYELDAFKYVKDICDRANIRYYAIGGTLLGAVRHKGFIPWDDDIDLAMPRKDYDKFIEVAPKLLPAHLNLKSYKYDKSTRCYISRIVNNQIKVAENLEDTNQIKEGYMIDILPIDGTPNHAIPRKLYYLHVMWLRFLCGACNVKDGINAGRPKKERILLNILKVLRVYRYVDIIHLYDKLDRLFKKQKYDSSKFIGTIMGAYKMKEIVPAEFFGSYSEFPFEDTTIKGPELWDEYLTHMYGDYMKIPKEHERKTHFKIIKD